VDAATNRAATERMNAFIVISELVNCFIFVRAKIVFFSELQYVYYIRIDIKARHQGSM